MTRKGQNKSEQTRTKVIKAAINAIYKDGFNAAHTNRIAEEADVSWGVLQYHFGDKDGLLQAVLDHIFDEFQTTLSNASLEEGDLKARLSELIDIVWGLISKKEYRVSQAILRNAGKDNASKINGQKQVKQWAGKISELWDALLQDHGVDPVTSEIARHLLFAGLRGLADDINPRTRLTRTSWQAERSALAESISYLLLKEASA